MEESVFNYGRHRYAYLLERSNRKSFSLIVTPSLRIVLKVPQNTTNEEIEQFLTKKWGWLEKQLNELERYQKTSFIKSYVSGESFYYLGRQYMLRVEKGKNEGVKISPGLLTLTTSKQIRDSEHNKIIYDKWYLERCESLFKKELVTALKEYNIATIPKLKIREMKTRWGSYQKNVVINLNPKLLQAPKSAIHYVITHELCHIEYKNHDINFYSLLESRIPDWKKIKDNLELRFG